VTTTGIGLALPTFTGTVAVSGEAGCLRAMAQRAEELGFAGLWVAEHLLRAPLIYRVSFLSPLSVLAHVAACTRHIRLGTAILVLPLRDPVLLAKELATLDLLTDGRLVLGIGTGWDAHEFESCGVPLRERGSRTDEALALLRFAPQSASEPVAKVVASAVANAEHNLRLDPEALVVSAAYVDEGPTLKRIRPRAQGRAFRINKRTSHITVEVSEVATSAQLAQKSRKARRDTGQSGPATQQLKSNTRGGTR